MPSPTDRRAYLLESELSPQRRARIEQAIAATEERCWAGLTSRERGDLLRLLVKAAASLEDQATAH